MNNKIGISTATFYPMDNIEAFKIISSMNIEVAELFLNTQQETSPEYLHPIREQAIAKNIEIAAIHPYFSGFEYLLFFSEHPARCDDSAKLYEMFFRAASYLGAKYLIFHGNRKDNVRITAKEYAVRMAVLSAHAAEYGITILQENVANHQCNSPDFVRELREASADSVNFVFDYKQAAKAGIDPYKLLNAMKGKVMHVHLNDYINPGSLSSGDTRLPFEGDGHLHMILEHLLTYNYIGSFVTEVYRQNYTGIKHLASNFDITRNRLNVLFSER